MSENKENSDGHGEPPNGKQSDTITKKSFIFNFTAVLIAAFSSIWICLYVDLKASFLFQIVFFGYLNLYWTILWISFKNVCPNIHSSRLQVFTLEFTDSPETLEIRDHESLSISQQILLSDIFQVDFQLLAVLSWYLGCTMHLLTIESNSNLSQFSFWRLWIKTLHFCLLINDWLSLLLPLHHHSLLLQVALKLERLLHASTWFLKLPIEDDSLIIYSTALCLWIWICMKKLKFSWSLILYLDQR